MLYMNKWGGELSPSTHVQGVSKQLNLAPITVKLGNYSDWNRGRDFTRAVPLPVDRVLKSVVHGYVSYIYLVLKLFVLTRFKTKGI